MPVDLVGDLAGDLVGDLAVDLAGKAKPLSTAICVWGFVTDVGVLGGK